MPRRNGKSGRSVPQREAVGRAFRDLEAPSAVGSPTSGKKLLQSVAGRGFWFWVAATLFGLVIGLLISRPRGSNIR